MLMNDTFNFNRFMLLLKRQWLGFGKIYLISLGVLTGLLILVYGFSLTDQTLNNISRNTLSFRYFLLIITGFLFLTILSSNYFAHLGQKSRAITEILLPASGFEKMMAALFYTFVLAVFSYILVFYIVDTIFLSNIRANRTATAIITDYTGKKVTVDYLSYFFTTDRISELLPFFYLPLSLISIFLLGSIYFQRFHYIKTAICLISFIIIWILTTIYTMKTVTDGTVWVGSQYWQREENIMFVFSVVGITLTLCFWVITYIRLKEKEV